MKFLELLQYFCTLKGGWNISYDPILISDNNLAKDRKTDKNDEFSEAVRRYVSVHQFGSE